MGPEPLRELVRRYDATVTASRVLEPGHYFLVVFAGKPPCEVRFAPWCGGGEPGSQHPEFECLTQLDLEPDEAIDLRIAGLPRFEGEAIPACPVSHLLHSESPALTDG